MLEGIRSRLTYANVVSTLCLFILLGAGAYAAGLAPNSVKSKHIKDAQVKTEDLAPNSIQSELVPDNELVGEDIDEATLGTVPNATNAANANNATDAGNANLLDNKDSTAFQEVGSEGWTLLDLNDEFAPTFCHWTSFGGVFADPSYFRDREGVVHLRGLARAIDGTSVDCGGAPADATIVSAGLPAGYRPGPQALFTVSSNDKPGRVDVTPGGSIAATPGYPAFADMKGYISLEGISFRCGPSGQNGCP